MRKAVIDVGSNSVLLLVEERTAGGWEFVDEQTAVTALGEGTKTTGLLGEPGVTATLEALRAMFERARELGVSDIRAAATMAARIASNTPEFLARCDQQRTPVEVLSGEDEARLGFEAVAGDPMFRRFDRISIIDPGGHSTELVTASHTGGRWVIEFEKSFPVGTLGLKSQVLVDESPGPMQILAAIERIDQILADVPPENAGVAVVLGATGTNLISIRERLLTWQPEKVHGAYLLFEEISRAAGWMMALTDRERAEIPGMERGRERTLHIGALILERFLQALKSEGCYVSVRGWRYAMLEAE